MSRFTAALVARLGVTGNVATQLTERDCPTNGNNVYFHFPFCFYEAFDSVSLEDLRLLSFSGILWMSYMRSQDDAIDFDLPINPKVLFFRDLYLRESVHLLYRLFSPESGFWAYYAKYFDEYASAVLSEHSDHRTIQSDYDEEAFYRIARGKAAMAKYPIAAQAVLSGREEKLQSLNESVDCFHIGYQFWDDLIDWKEDFSSRNYSFLLSKSIKELAVDERQLALRDAKEKVGRTIYQCGLADDHLKRASDWLERAYQLAMDSGCTLWASHVKLVQSQVEKLSDDLKSIMSSRKVLPSPSRRACESVGRGANSQQQ